MRSRKYRKALCRIVILCGQDNIAWILTSNVGTMASLSYSFCTLILGGCGPPDAPSTENTTKKCLNTSLAGIVQRG